MWVAPRTPPRTNLPAVDEAESGEREREPLGLPAV
jgi:hypothetical protein